MYVFFSYYLFVNIIISYIETTYFCIESSCKSWFVYLYIWNLLHCTYPFLYVLENRVAINSLRKYITRSFRLRLNVYVLHVRGAFPTKWAYLLHAVYLSSSETIDRLGCCFWRRQNALFVDLLFPLPQSKANRNSLAISEHTDFWKFDEKTIVKIIHDQIQSLRNEFF